MWILVLNMTHGEELVSEMHQDSIVVTYLEGLLMHQVVGGSSSVIDKKPDGPGAEDQNFSVSGNSSPRDESQRDGPLTNTHTYRSSGMLHHKKARLLQSSEDWNAAKRRRLSDSIVDLNGKKEALLAGMVENVPKGKQDSTLLASLLQSFSSRLQSVALSQQIRQSLKEQGYSLSLDSLQTEKDLRCYGVASSHLKTLLKKSKAKDEKLETNLPELTTNNLVKDRFIESSRTGQSGPKVMSEPLSCAARLQAVASMVEKRASPATSPKPSVACSQLALLLSSEAHLQQYSREHALKAQNANQIASERLAAMARLKESAPKDIGSIKLSKSSHLNGQTRSSTKSITNKSNMTSFQSPMGIIHSSPKTISYKAAIEKNNLKPHTNSSLLLHLLKNHSATKQAKGYEQNERSVISEENGTQYSDNNLSFTKENSSDDESSHCNCLPIDLSFKHKTSKPDSELPGSLDNLTQSLLHNWDSKVPYLENIEEKDASKTSKLNPQQKVTLLQLLLGHKSEDDKEKNETEETLADMAKCNISTGSRTPATECFNANRITPVNTPPLLASTTADSPINLSHHSPLLVKHNSSPYTCIIQPERLVNPASKHLIDLTVHKDLQGTKMNRNEMEQNRNESVQTSSFSASKLLQNLAQCGLQSSMSVDEQRKGGKQAISVNTEKAIGLIDGLNSSILTNKSGTLEENTILTSQPLPTEQKFPSSEIQNLLERRTVLQLLLGTSNKGMSETKERMLPKEESLQDQTEKVLNEQVLTVKIKTEPSEELNAFQSPNAQQIRETVSETFQGIAHSLETNTAVSSTSEEHKTDSFPAQDFSFSKNGLLSRLLRQSQDGYSGDNLDGSRRDNESTSVESKRYSTVPKKRKLHSEPSDGPLKLLKGNITDAANNHKSSAEALYGPGLNQKELKFSRTDVEFKYSSGHDSTNESESRSWSRESKGFNVLKQLLLSENCEKDLSRHRNNSAVTEGKKKGSRNNLTNNNKAEFSVSSIQKLIENSGQQTNCLDHRTFQYSVAMKSPTSTPLSDHLGDALSLKPECDQFSVCQVPTEKGPIKWVIADMDKNERERESPRLTKTNPILYYMLQKGGSSVNIQEAHGKDIWSEPSFTESSAAVTIKKELSPVAECKIPFHNLRNPYNGHLNNSDGRQHIFPFRSISDQARNTCFRFFKTPGRATEFRNPFRSFLNSSCASSTKGADTGRVKGRGEGALTFAAAAALAATPAATSPPSLSGVTLGTPTSTLHRVWEVILPDGDAAWEGGAGEQTSTREDARLR